MLTPGRGGDHYRGLGREWSMANPYRSLQQPTYLINVRGADSNAGYVTSGFWGGTFHQIALANLSSDGWESIPYSCNFEIREPMERLRLVSSSCNTPNGSSALSAGLQLVTWLVPNYICSAVCICFTGFFLAPIFPCAIVMITELIPDELHVGVIGLFGTIGGAGAAAMPFILGAMSDRVRPLCDLKLR